MFIDFLNMNLLPLHVLPLASRGLLEALKAIIDVFRGVIYFPKIGVSCKLVLANGNHLSIAVDEFPPDGIQDEATQEAHSQAHLEVIIPRVQSPIVAEKLANSDVLHHFNTQYDVGNNGEGLNINSLSPQDPSIPTFSPDVPILNGPPSGPPDPAVGQAMGVDGRRALGAFRAEGGLAVCRSYVEL